MTMKKVARLLAAVLLLVAIMWLLVSQYTNLVDPVSLVPKKPGRKLTGLKQPVLEKVDAQAQFSSLYLQAEFLHFRPNTTERLSVSVPPAAPFESVDVTAFPPEAPTKVPLPSYPQHVDASSLLFGIATTLARLDESLNSFAYWASDNQAHIVVVVSPRDEAEGLTYEGVESRAKHMGIRLTLVEMDKGYIERYISLIEVLANHVESTTEWCGIIDDDTFFPSMGRLLTMLRKYDASQPHYIGGLSEDFKSVERWGFQAFGGAGVFLTVALVRQIRPRMEDCARLSISSGDGKLAICIYQFSTATLRPEPGLHQIDLFGDITGFYEAARPLPVSLHHWKSWSHHDMVKISAISKVTGPETTFQKYLLADGFWMTHGFSIVKYNRDSAEGSLTHVEGSMENTFNLNMEEAEKSYRHSLAPLRPRDEAKVQFMMEAAVEENEGTMSLYYVRRQDGVGTGIIRVIWSSNLY